jgi:hypothetical protein
VCGRQTEAGASATRVAAQLGDRLGVVESELGTLGPAICADDFGSSMAVGHVLARMGAQVVLSPSAWAVDADHDEAVALYGQLWRDSYNELARLYDVTMSCVRNVGWIAGETTTITPRSAIWIGLVRGLCLPFRGFSRSGATISTALLRGIARPPAEDFSFALAVVVTPPVIVRSVLRLLRAREWSSSVELGNLILPGVVGMVFSFVAGLAALRLLSAMLEQGRWKYFGCYCLVAAVVVAAAAVCLPAVPAPSPSEGIR